MTALATPQVGWKCAVCGARVPISTSLAWRCPQATDDDTHHVLHLEQPIAPLRSTGDVNPYVAFRKYLAWDAFAAALGMTDDDRVALIRETDLRVEKVAGTGFRFTPFARHDLLSDALGFGASGGVWVKDETNGVAGSHKSRHLFTELLHLLATERTGVATWSSTETRPPLAIASCGNAAFAASTLAKAVNWPIRVFVPENAAAELTNLLESVDALIERCPRLPDDPPGDPCVHRFREAVAHGAIPFGVQGTENAWCLDGGRTIGWEMADSMERVSGPPLDRVFMQVGGGAFAACGSAGLFAGGLRPKLHAVQTEQCAPLARAWNHARDSGGAKNAGARWSDCMWPWESVKPSLADGILDDETYDWIGVCNQMADSGGSPIVVTEQHVVDAYSLAHRATDINVSPTGTAGLAGLLAMRSEIADDERVVVVFSGVRRHFMPLPSTH
jgi:threonine dehydratase